MIGAAAAGTVMSIPVSVGGPALESPQPTAAETANPTSTGAAAILMTRKKKWISGRSSGSAPGLQPASMIRALKTCSERSEGRRLGEHASPEGLIASFRTRVLAEPVL